LWTAPCCKLAAVKEASSSSCSALEPAILICPPISRLDSYNMLVSALDYDKLVTLVKAKMGEPRAAGELALTAEAATRLVMEGGRAVAAGTLAEKAIGGLGSTPLQAGARGGHPKMGNSTGSP
jgi:hypothetical protein